MMTLIITQSLRFFSGFFNSDIQTEKHVPAIYETPSMQLIAPEYSLGEGSLQIQPKQPIKHFSDWNNNHKLETYTLIQKVIQVWKEKGITDYLIYAKEDANASTKFTYEIVPYPKTHWLIARIWKQFKVLWNLIFGGSYSNPQKRNLLTKNFSLDLSKLPETKKVDQIIQQKDPFCDPNVIQKQLVFEGKNVNVLYNYAPIALGKEKLHFLIVPKEHRTTFADLTPEEYLEASNLSQKIVQHFQNKGYSLAHLFNKAGKDAGQTVPHWHEHIVFASHKTDELLSKLKVLKNMLFYSSPLPPQELSQKVQHLKSSLASCLGGSAP